MITISSSGYEEKIKSIHLRTSFINRPEADTVREIIKDIKNNGNRALLEYISKYEYPASLFSDIVVSSTEVDLAHARVDDEHLAILQKAINNVRTYHEKFLLKSWSAPVFQNSSYGMKATPIRRVGVYVPGGTAVYPSTVLMNVIPANVAGVKEIVLVTPSNKEGKINDMILAAAKELGVTEIYRMGGAQAIGALAFGTQDLDPVDLIVGPGNIYVTLAKKEVYGVVGIDKLAGPSDICVIADNLSNPKYIAADLLAQAEHDNLASAILITDSLEQARQVQKELEIQFSKLDRKEILKQVFENNSAIFVVPENDLETISRLTNLIAPEHLEIFHGNYKELVQKINNAGAIFLGEYSAEVLGDYGLGPNHVLPTGGTARFSSPLSAVDFMKTSSIINITKKDYHELGSDTAKFADLEGLPAHANAARIRL